MPRTRVLPLAFGLLGLVLAPVVLGACKEDEPGGAKPGSGGAGGLAARVDEAVAKGRALLVSQQGEDGSIGGSLGYTTLAVQALVAATPREKVTTDPAIQKALKYLASNAHEDGGIWDEPTKGLSNYVTSAAIGAFMSAKDPQYGALVGRAKDFLVASQFQGKPDDLNYGAFPYSASSPRPADLSNVQFAAQALSDAGLPKDHPAWQRILTFLAKVQNRSESNSIRVERDADGNKETNETVVSGDDGGSAYAPGLSYAGWDKRSDGTWQPRSYGSMTYALLKTLLLAGVDPKDPRVVAALGWIAKNFAVDRNPGFESTKDPAKEGQQGYYYFLYTAAVTLSEYERIAGTALPVTDSSGRSHAWRVEIAEELLRRRGASGGWVNETAERWEEGNEVLATSYAVIALARARGGL